MDVTTSMCEMKHSSGFSRSSLVGLELDYTQEQMLLSITSCVVKLRH